MATERDILTDAMDQFGEAEDGWSHNRQAAEEDFRFALLGEQWPEHIRREREAEGRPCLTINRQPAFIRQVVNDARQNKPGISVAPVDNGADEDTADVIAGLCRSVERRSRASIAYDTAIEHAVAGGYGYFTLSIDYVHGETFDKEIRINRVPNPLMIYGDAMSTDYGPEDWRYGFQVDAIGADEFARLYPDAKPVSFAADRRDTVAPNVDGEDVVTAVHWCREPETSSLLLVEGPDGERVAVREDSLQGWMQELHDALGIDPAPLFQVIEEREVERWKVMRRVLSGNAVLEEVEWPGQTIPIFPVYGSEIVLDGKRYVRSMVRDARGPQQMFNFWRSATTELVALAPRAPWLMPSGALPQKGAERAKWGQANARSFAYLTYEGPVPPKREQFAGVPAGAIQEALNAADDMKSITGIYDPALGNRSNETSGRAILARQRESDVSNFHFQDNLNRAIESCARAMVEIIPSVYGARHSIRILGDDMSEKVVQLARRGMGTQLGPDGGPRLYDLSVGTYDVTVKAGPSYQTQREEQQTVLTEIVRARPDAFSLMGDILFETMDFPGAEQIAERLRLLLPPQVQQAEGMAPPGPQPGQPALPPPQGGPQGQPPGPQPVQSAPSPPGAEAMTGTVEARPVWAV